MFLARESNTTNTTHGDNIASKKTVTKHKKSNGRKLGGIRDETGMQRAEMGSSRRVTRYILTFDYISNYTGFNVNIYLYISPYT